MAKINVLIIGSGHYSTGTTAFEGKISTDKDIGVFLPSILELRKKNLVEKVFIATRDGRKVPKLRNKIHLIGRRFGWNTDIEFFPTTRKVVDNSYIEALSKLPKPGAVLIATPDFLHKQMIIEAIKRNIHFMVVKPAVTKLNDLKEIILAQESRNILGLVDYHKVYDEANLLLRNQYLSGEYGEIQHVSTKMTQKRIMLKIFQNWIGKNNHNINHYLGSHYIHMVGFVTGAVPLRVRATAQYGVARKEYRIDTPDLIETCVEWKSKFGNKFVSYHIAGWSDPLETPSMTYQEIHIISTKGHIDSDQRYRGFEKVLTGNNTRVINPYFFTLNQQPDGSLDLDTQYGYKSVKTFIKSAISLEEGELVSNIESTLPTIKDSLYVTAILEAADKSLRYNSSIEVIRLDRQLLKMCNKL